MDVESPFDDLSDASGRLERLQRRRRSYPLWRLIRANARDIGVLVVQSRFSLGALGGVLLLGAIYLHWGYFPQQCAQDPGFCPPPDLIEVGYETLQLLLFQSGLAFPADWLGRGLFFAIPLLGLFFLLQSLIDFVRVLFNKNARPEVWQVSLAATFSDHVLVTGLGRIGYRVVLQLLDAGFAVVVIERDWQNPFVAAILRLKVPVIAGDARDPDVLRSAGVLRARAMIAAINDDLLNIEIALSARRINPQIHPVLRIFNRQLDTRLEHQFGKNSAFSSSALAAPTMAAAAVSRDIVHVLTLPEGLLGIAELTVTRDSQLTGFVQAIEDQLQVRVLTCRNAQGRNLQPGFSTNITAGDTLLLLGRLEALERARIANEPGSKLGFLSHTAQAAPPQRLDTIIVCGLGRVGTQTVRLLHRMQPRPTIVAICLPNTLERHIAEVVALGVRVVHGDASEPAILREAGIERAYAVAALASDDLVNLQIGLAARAIRDDLHLVLRVFSDVLADRLAALFGIHTAFSTSALAAPTLSAAALERGIDQAFDVGDKLFATQTMTLGNGQQFVGESVGGLRQQHRLWVIAVRRGGRVARLPKADVHLQIGDEIVLLGEIGALAAHARHPFAPSFGKETHG